MFIYYKRWDGKVEAVLTVTILYMGYLLACPVPLGLRVARRSPEKARVPLIHRLNYSPTQITRKFIDLP